jgi:multifunctional cyclase/dehydratase/O-methyltransferase
MTDTTTTAAPASDVLPYTRGLSSREQQIAVLGSWNQLGHVIYVLSALAIADHLADGPRTVQHLADVSDSHATALYRILRCAAAFGIMTERDDGTFALADLGEGLRSDRLGGLRPMAMFSGAQHVRLAYTDVMYSVRTGRPAFDRVHGMSFYDYLKAHPERGQDFDRFLAHWSNRLSALFAGRLDLKRFRRVADIGGGDGYFLAALLQQHPDMVGELFDLPDVTNRAVELLRDRGIDRRVTVTGGDFLRDPLPRGCDAYILKSIIHNWQDGEAVTILRRVREAMGATDGRLLIIDQIVPSSNAWDHAKVLDIDMLVLFGGRERELPEWEGLFSSAGFTLTSPPAEHGWTVLECRPV